ncbi:ATP-binding protein [Hydrogenophaga sp.]|uniref:sensor histidine kinase n=1 Tax=Hydrogenophaga sp. TaxID=1904254 RepID=UPI0027241CDE|nr:PAS domain-containing sensor histidine kinase [Hydrogenophaga sp.]MDO9438790.1 ATP-binding protein [Hydrogenophaga sp.]
MNFEHLLELSSELWLCAADGKVTFANRAAHELLAPSMPQVSLVNMRLADFGWGALEVNPTSMAGVFTHLCDGTVMQTDLRVAVDEVSHRLAIRVIPIAGAAIQATPQRLERLLKALDVGPHGMLLIRSSTWTVLDANEVACRMLRHTREQLIGAHTYGPWWEYKNRESIDHEFRRLMDQYPQPIVTEVLGYHRKGRRYPVELTKHGFQLGGEWIIAVTMRDLAERVMAQQQIEQMRLAVNEAVDGVYMIDPELMEYVDVNEGAGKLYGIDRETLLERGLRWVMNEAQADEADLRARYAELIRTYPAAYTAERLLRRDDGVIITIESTRRAVFLHNRWLIASVARDITQRKAAEQEIKRRMAELARSNQDLEQFAYVTSHDLMEPLRMMSSYAQLLKRRYATQLDDDAREFIEFIIGGAQRMRLLIDALLVYSRAGRANAQMKSVALDEALDDALANLAQAISDCRATIVRDPLPLVEADPIGMMQLFQNLVGNALKFRTGHEPQVRIFITDLDSHWRVSVEDNGIGIEPEYVDRIFTAFQRLHPRSSYEGAGIGLSICKKIVERHGGRIWVEVRPVPGTLFHFTLPKQQADVASAL